VQYLATLVLGTGRPVPVRDLAEAIWGTHQTGKAAPRRSARGGAVARAAGRRQVHAAILGGFRSPVTGAALLPREPRQLPPEVSGFTGRDREIARLDALLLGSGPPGTIAVISGTAGVGKTCLALQWARRNADRFPDGQLWVNLRGYDDRPAMTTGQALRLFLRALGVPAEAIPPDVDSRTGLYRSFMDGRRALVVVDNGSCRAGPTAAAERSCQRGDRDQPQSAHRSDRRRERAPGRDGPLGRPVRHGP
jgi:hypothetical protein